MAQPETAPLAPSALNSLLALLGNDCVTTRIVDRAAMARDASHYLLRPQAVATPRTAADIGLLLAWAAEERVPLTFRSGGSSLSGQASTAGVLVDTRRYFTKIEVLDGGRRVRCEPGAVLRAVNARLATGGYRLGPDPASEAACTIGGVVANNSSGMSSGHLLTAYHTVESMIIVLPKGTVIDTSDDDADDQLQALEPALWSGLVELRDLITRRPDLRAEIERQFAMKNTMGYSINALVDAHRPVDVLAKLMTGSEGTLGFVASVTFRTVALLPQVATTLLIFPDLVSATDALPSLIATGATSIELLDSRSLRVAQSDPDAPTAIHDLEVDNHTALLVEYARRDLPALKSAIDSATEVLDCLPLAIPARLSTDPKQRAALWRVRKGLYATVAGARPKGTIALLEDIVVPPTALSAAVAGLQQLLHRYAYDDAVIFGHARDGNLHFMINPDLADAVQLSRYANFTADMVNLVLDHGGSLKAEHGTGRIMAPFVSRQYGAELYQIMRQIKQLCDPTGVMNPGVIIDDNPRSHLQHLKSTPPVIEEIDRCVDCGYCEPVCPSRNLTTSPRQRIALLRAIADAPPGEKTELERDYGYDAIDTCAADSLCTLACPVHIDTGAMMKTLRADRQSNIAQRSGVSAARHWKSAVTGIRTGLRIADRLPAPMLRTGSSALRTITGTELIPQLDADLPSGGPARLIRTDTNPDVILFASCMGSIFAPAPDRRGASRAFAKLCQHVGLRMATISGLDNLCCAMPWSSKGLTGGADEMTARVRQAIALLPDGVPIVADAASCTHALQGIADKPIIDVTSYTANVILPRLGRIPKLRKIVVHPTCSTEHLNATDALITCAQAVAEEVIVPSSWGCCGFAGDRGLLHPELTASATSAEAAEVPADADAYVSANRTCEWGLTRATGNVYEHVLEVLESLILA